nr:cytochrome P450 [Tanacetum cinerariifolium]
MDFLTSPIFISSAIAALLLLVFLYIFNQNNGKKYHPVGGTVIDLLINYNKLHHYMTHLAEKYKTYRIIGLYHADVYTSDPVNVEYILKTNFHNYGKGTHNHDLMKELLGDGIFTVDGGKWRQQRKHKKDDILSRFVLINNNDPKYLRDIILNFVLAGKDPIAITMLWFIYELCKHPEVQDRVVKEIKEAINMKEEITNVAEFAACVTDAAFENMQYLQAALTETIRLYPALPVDPKICFSDDVLPDGCSVKKGSMVAFTPYAMGKMKFIWGDDAHEFKPERWIDRNGLFRTESPFKFTAFQVASCSSYVMKVKPQGTKFRLTFMSTVR